MENNRVLIVSDNPDRRNFLQYHVRGCRMIPVWYPNIFSAGKAIANDSFTMIVVDLSIPVHLKVNIVRESCNHHPGIKVITVGKKAYLEKTAVLSGCPSVMSLDSIESFPEKLAEYAGG